MTQQRGQASIAPLSPLPMKCATSECIRISRASLREGLIRPRSTVVATRYRPPSQCRTATTTCPLLSPSRSTRRTELQAPPHQVSVRKKTPRSSPSLLQSRHLRSRPCQTVRHCKTDTWTRTSGLTLSSDRP